MIIAAVAPAPDGTFKHKSQTFLCNFSHPNVRNELRFLGFFPRWDLYFLSKTLLHTFCKALLILQNFLSRRDTILYCPRQVHSQLNTTTIKQGVAFFFFFFSLCLSPYPSSLEYSNSVHFLFVFCSLFVVLSFLSLAPELQRKAYVNLWWNGVSRRERRARRRERERWRWREGEKTFAQNGPASKCMLINGCSINQWNIIKFKQCDFSSLARRKPDSKHGCLQGLRWPQSPQSKGQRRRLSPEGLVDPIVSHA